MEVLDQWHEFVKNQDAKQLKSLLDRDAVFYSPLLFKPQKGKAKVTTYLIAASKIFDGGGFHYVKEIEGTKCAILEFNAVVDSIQVDGVDIISWNDEGKITEFKVMIRPFTAIQKVGEKMKSMLEDLSVWEKIKFSVL